MFILFVHDKFELGFFSCAIDSFVKYEKAFCFEIFFSGQNGKIFAFLCFAVGIVHHILLSNQTCNLFYLS